MSAIGTIKEIGEIVQKYNDLELMKKIIALQNEVFELNQNNLNLKQELAALKGTIQQREELKLKQVGQCHYYFKENDEIPFCPKCFEGSQKLIHLPNAEPWNKKRLPGL